VGNFARLVKNGYNQRVALFHPLGISFCDVAWLDGCSKFRLCYQFRF